MQITIWIQFFSNLAFSSLQLFSGLVSMRLRLTDKFHYFIEFRENVTLSTNCKIIICVRVLHGRVDKNNNNDGGYDAENLLSHLILRS